MSEQKYSVTIDVGADISNARAAMKDLQKIFNTQSLGAGQSSKLTGMFSDLSKALDELEKKSGKTFTSIGEVNGIEKAKNRVSSLIGDIAREFNKIQGLGDTDLGKNFIGLADKLDSASKAFKTYDDAIAKNKKRQTELQRELDKTQKEYQKQKDAYKEYETFKNKLPQDKIKGLQQSGIKKYLENEQRVAEEQAVRTRQELEKYTAGKGYKDAITRTGDVRKGQDFSDDQGLINLAKNAKDAKDQLDSVNKSLDNFNKATKNLAPPKDTEALGKQIKQIKEEMASLTNGTLNQDAFNQLKTTLGQIFGEDLFKDIQNSDNAIDKFKERINSISTERITALKTEFPQITQLLEALGISAEKAGNKIEAGADEIHRFTEAGREIDAVSSRLKYFFSLAGGFNLMRRAIRQAIATTKELDAVMTQTAVVSQYTVGDMWKTLPQYSKEAKKLGAEIKDVYSAQTLYVQQGLDMNSAMDLGIETLKMARVANIDASEATNSMTAALRGFNMELNQTSAQRVNDVYSKLAQNTASDVKEISTAMTKTAALANSANMSFENTAAFLATIIESTREGAETAGTALKTVIARFTEVKKLYTEDQLTGTDEEGQEIDVNKISTALKTAGINMNEFFTGAKGLDEIFKELGSKWNSLTTVQQRYIATQAAGSRQQSRFLALMQNYSRTVELTDMAYNSAGSGQEQFEKTLDSLEAKINKFKDEWNTFIMGIANSDLIKGFIDTGTKILEVINNIIDAISGGNGLVKSITSIGAAFGVFKIGGAIFKKGLGNIGALFTGKGQKPGYLDKLIGVGQGAQSGAKMRAMSMFMRQSLQNTFSPFEKVAFTNEQLALAKEYRKKIEEDDKLGKELYGNTPYQSNQLYRDNLKKEFSQKTGLNEKEADAALNGKTKVYQQTADSANALANASMLAGGAILGLTSALEASGKISKQAAGVWKGVGAAILAFGGVLKVTTLLVKTFGKTTELTLKSIPFVGWALAAVAAITALGVALNNTFSAKAKAEAATQFADDVKSAADEAKRNLQEIEDKIEDIGSQQDAFSELIVGTEEWNSAVQNLNQSILELIQLYPELAGAVEYVDGHLALNTKSQEYQDWIKAQKEKVNNIEVAQESASYSKRKLEVESEFAGGFWKVNTREEADVFKNGLEQRLKEANIGEQIISDIISGIKQGSITNATTLETYLKTLTEDQAKAVRQAFLVEDKEFQADQYSESGGTWVSVKKDKTNELIRAERLRTTATDKTNFVRSASQVVEQRGLEQSDYANMWLAIAEQQIYNMVEEIGELPEGFQKAMDQAMAEISKADYAKLLGKSVKEVTDEQYNAFIRTQAARQMALTGELALPELQGANSDQLAQAQALITGKIENLTLEQLKALKNFDYASIEGYATISEETAKAFYQNLFNGFEQFQPNIEELSQTTGQVQKYEETAVALRKQGVSDQGIKDIFSSLTNVLNGISDADVKEGAQSLLSAIDFTSRDSIRKGIEAVRNLGVVIDDNLVDNLIKASKATKQFSETKLKEKLEGISKASSIVEKIKGGEVTLTEQEHADLKESLGQYYKEEDWVNNGFDKWTYIGDNTNSLLTAINTVVNQIAGDMRSELQSSVEKGKSIEQNLGTILYSNEGEYLGSVFKLISQWSEMVGQDESFGKNSAAIAPELLQILGLADNATIQDVLDVYNKYYGAEGNALKINQEQFQKMQSIYGTQIAGSLTSGQAVLTQANQGNITEEDATATLRAGVAELNEEVQILTEQDIEDFGEKFENVLNALAIDSQKAAKGFEDLTNAYKDNAKVLTKENAGTKEYKVALASLTKAARKAYGDNEVITEQFVEENLGLFENFAKGTEGSADAIRDAIVAKMKEAGTDIDVINAALEGLNDAKFNINGTADFSQVFNKFAETEAQAEALKSVLQSLGYSVELQMGEAIYENGQLIGHNWHAVVRNNAGQIETDNRHRGGGGGGGGKKDFKNDFDKYYNQVEDINELIRQRNLLESDYNQLLKAEGTSGADIYKNLQKQLKLLEERRKLTADLADKRKQQLFETMQADEYKDVAKYAKWNDEDQTIEIDWEAINKIKDTEEGDLVKEYIKKLEEFQSKYDDQVQALEEIEDLVQEIKDRGKEEYKSLEDRVRDALIKQIQDKIDELTEVDKAINETNQKLFDSISQTLELQRQERTNKKTEEELSDKEKRLAYLQQDSSNANAVEIAQLQKELADARQDYTDNLIDQKISELQRQNDEAQEQRQQQIELMQQSLDWQEKSGAFWQQVYSLMSAGIDSSGVLISDSQLAGLLKAGEGWDNLSQFQKMDWLKSLETLVAQAVGFLSLNRQLEDLGVKEGTQITFTNMEGQTLTGTVDKNGNVIVKNPEGGTTTYTGVYQDYAGHYHTVEDTPGPDETETQTPEEPPTKEYTYRQCSKKKDKPIYHWRISKVDGKEVKELEEHDFDKDGVCTKCKYKKKKKSGKTGTDDTTPEGGESTTPEKPGKPSRTGTETPEKPEGTDNSYELVKTSYKQINDKIHEKIETYQNKNGKIEEEFSEESHAFGPGGFCRKCGYTKGDRYDTEPQKPEEHSDDYTAPEKPEGTTQGPGEPQTPDKDDHVHEPAPGGDFWKSGEKEWHSTPTKHWQEWVEKNVSTGEQRNRASKKEDHDFSIETKLNKQCSVCGYKQSKPQPPPAPYEPQDPQKPQSTPSPDSETVDPQKPQGTPPPDSETVDPQKPQGTPPPDSETAGTWVITGTVEWDHNSTYHWKTWFEENTKTGSQRKQSSQQQKHNLSIETDLYKECSICGYKQPNPGPPPGRESEEPSNPQPLPPPGKPQGTPKPPARDPQEDTTGPEKPNYKWIEGTEYISSGAQTHTKYNYSYKIDDNNDIVARRLDSSATEKHNWQGATCRNCGESNPNYKEPENPVHGPIGPGGGSGGPGRPGDVSTRNFTAFSPEEILSSRNSDAFMYLTDVYSNASKSNLTGVMDGNNNYYDIDIQVESLSSDYDVDKAIDRIKARIAQENAYRNVNTLSRLR